MSVPRALHELHHVVQCHRLTSSGANSAPCPIPPDTRRFLPIAQCHLGLSRQLSQAQGRVLHLFCTPCVTGPTSTSCGLIMLNFVAEIRRARFAVLLELTQHAVHLKPLADLLAQAQQLEHHLLEGLASREKTDCKQARQAVQDLLQLQRTSATSPVYAAALAAVDALLGMLDGLAMYELRLVRGTWAVHWPVFLSSCAQLAAAQRGGDAVEAATHWQLGLAGVHLQTQYLKVLIERALQHRNPTVQQFAAMAAAEVTCNSDVAAALHVEAQWVAGDLARLLMAVPGCSQALQQVSQLQVRLLL